MRSKALITLLLIIFCSQVHAELKIVTHDEAFVVWLQMALDTKTGNIGIFYVTRNWSNQNIWTAYFALIEFNGAGDSHVVKIVKIGVNVFGGGICYNSKLEKFCVAYSIGFFPKSMIKLQFFNPSGKSSRIIEPFEKNKYYDKSPLIIYNEKKGNYFLGWSRGNTYSVGWNDPIGLLTTTLDAHGKATGEIRSYAKVEETTTYQHIPEFHSVSMNKNNNKYYVIYNNPKVVNYSKDETSSTVEFMTLNNKGDVVSQRMLADCYSGGRYWRYKFSQIPETSSGKKGNTILAWVKEEKPYYQIIGPKGKKMANFAINDMFIVDNMAVAYSDSQNRSILVFGTVSRGEVLIRHLDSSGRLTDQTTELWRQRNVMMTRALWNSKINKFIVLWTSTYGYKNIHNEVSLWVAATN